MTDGSHFRLAGLALLALFGALQIAEPFPPAVAKMYPAGWTGLAELRRTTVDDLLDRHSKVIVYYLEKSGTKALKLELMSGISESADVEGSGRFICLVKAPRGNHPMISACGSTSGTLFPAAARIKAQPLFDDGLVDSEIDRSQVLFEGSNDQLLHISPFRFPIDEMPEVQKIGADNFTATCSSLHLTAPDRIGAVNLLETRLRPHFLARFPPIGDGGIQTRAITSVHLKGSESERFICEQAAAVGPDLVLVVSGDRIVLIDRDTGSYAVIGLPLPRRGFLLVRQVSQ